MSAPNGQVQNGEAENHSTEGENNTPDEGGDDSDIAKQIDAKVNAAISNHLTRFRAAFEKEIGKQMQSTMESAMNPLNEKLTAFAEAAQSQDESSKTPDEKADLIEKKYSAQVQELENRLRQEQEQRQAEASARAREEERNALSKALNNAGISGVQQRAAIALLYGEENRVIRDDTGDIKFTLPKAGYTDEVSLDDGVSEWLKTDEGKAFMPPRGAAGSGAGGSQAAQSQRGPRTKDEAKQRAKMQLAEALGVVPSTADGY